MYYVIGNVAYCIENITYILGNVAYVIRNVVKYGNIGNKYDKRKSNCLIYSK